MSVEIWPHISPPELKVAEEATQKRELEWLLNELHETLTELKHGLEDCYALLAPVDPGTTLVVSSHRNEIVKGHISRVGTRILKGTLHLRMRTLPPQTFTIDPDQPIQLAPLTNLHTLLTHSIDLLTLTLSYTYPPDGSSSYISDPSSTTPRQLPTSNNAPFVAAQLRLLSQSLAEATSLLKGPPPTTASDPSWTIRSCSPAHFTPLPGTNLSVYWGVQESSLVLWLRALEPADAPVNFGTKLALAIGTTRRLEHDEADRVFTYHSPAASEGAAGGPKNGGGGGGSDAGKGEHGSGGVWDKSELQVYVREKVRVDSADPSLMSMYAKLIALGHTLAQARRNLAAVMGEELED